ncbi:Hypothetical predicted protein [Olea europaea subsp. europaea]|uniref:DUF7028 domain-containing protein n=1 Tax=Olea europaea subsp. europaea TaxID=158383 RepID=A0A8S0QIJ7_OLEEU|nr:Hypothetical predicted protein [Olea europaea subsp. europaea]
MSDEIVTGIHMLRLTRYWDEVTDEWEPQESWFFLELIEAVLVDNFKITIKELNSYGDLVEEGPLLPEFQGLALDVVLNQHLGKIFARHHQFEERIYQDNLEFISDVLTREEEIFCVPPTLPILSPNPVETSRTGSNNHNETACIISSTMSHMEIKSSKQRQKWEWVSIVPDLVPGPEVCPDATVTCYEMYKRNKSPSSTFMLNARKHLLHLGWKIDFVNDGKPRMRYNSPDGIIYYSIRVLCSEIGSERPFLSTSEIRKVL